MRLGINLRDDLKRLTDAQIAAELERLLDEREKLYGSVSVLVVDQKLLYRWGLLFPFGRGLIHHPLAYKLCGGGFGRFTTIFGCLYLLDCEIKDVRDEIQRRVKRRKPRAELAR
jgi:hypothetical protein